MTELPFMNIPVDTIIAATAEMSPEEFGAFFRILMAMWRAGGELVDDDVKLARTVRTDKRHWKRLRPTVLADMSWHGSRFHHPTLLESITKARRRVAQRKGASNARWEKHKSLKSLMPGHADAYAAGHANVPAKKMRTRMRTTSNNNNNHNNNTSSPQTPELELPKTLATMANPRKLSKEQVVRALMELSGTSEVVSQLEFKGLLAKAGNDIDRLFELCREASGSQPSDPLAWLHQQLQEAKNSREMMDDARGTP